MPVRRRKTVVLRRANPVTAAGRIGGVQVVAESRKVRPADVCHHLMAGLEHACRAPEINLQFDHLAGHIEHAIGRAATPSLY